MQGQFSLVHKTDLRCHLPAMAVKLCRKLHRCQKIAQSFIVDNVGRSQSRYWSVSLVWISLESFHFLWWSKFCFRRLRQHFLKDANVMFGEKHQILGQCSDDEILGINRSEIIPSGLDFKNLEDTGGALQETNNSWIGFPEQDCAGISIVLMSCLPEVSTACHSRHVNCDIQRHLLTWT